MRWVLAGICFALMVGLAVATAAIKTENIRMRAQLSQLEQRRADLVAATEYERNKLRSVVDPRNLTRIWLQLEEGRLQ